MLDKLPPAVRHFSLMLIAALLAWGVDTLPRLNIDPILASLCGAVLTMVIAYVTPLTRQYGVGSGTDGTGP